MKGVDFLKGPLKAKLIWRRNWGAHTAGRSSKKLIQIVRNIPERHDYKGWCNEYRWKAAIRLVKRGVITKDDIRAYFVARRLGVVDDS